MKREILVAAAVLWAGPASAADPGHCDSKPFTLKKPTVPQPKPAPAPPAVAPAAPKPAPSQGPPHKMAKADKPKYQIGCKQPKG